jgi:hypothetical protein
VGLGALAQSEFGLSKQVFQVAVLVGLGAGVLGVLATLSDLFASSSPRLRSVSLFLTAAALTAGLGWVSGSIAASPTQSPSAASVESLNEIFSRLAKERQSSYKKLQMAQHPGRQSAISKGLARNFLSGAAEIKGARFNAEAAPFKRRIVGAMRRVASSYRTLGAAFANPVGSQAKLRRVARHVEAETDLLQRAEERLKKLV